MKSISKPNSPIPEEEPRVLKMLGNHSLKYQKLNWQAHTKAHRSWAKGLADSPALYFKQRQSHPAAVIWLQLPPLKTPSSFPARHVSLPAPVLLSLTPMWQVCAWNTRALQPEKGAASPAPQKHSSITLRVPFTQRLQPWPSPGWSLPSFPSRLDQPEFCRLWKWLIRIVPPICCGPLNLI